MHISDCPLTGTDGGSVRRDAPPPGCVSRIELLVENKKRAAFEVTECDSSAVEAVKFHLTAVSGPVKTACGARATHAAPSSAEGFRF